MVGIIIIQIIKIFGQGFCQGGLAGLSRPGNQDDFPLQVFKNIVFQVSFHADYSDTDSGKVKTFSELTPKKSTLLFSSMRGISGATALSIRAISNANQTLSALPTIKYGALWITECPRNSPYTNGMQT